MPLVLRRPGLSLGAVAFVAMAGCTGYDNDMINVAACDQLKAGGFVAVEAHAAPTVGAPNVSASTPYNVTLATVSGGKGGYISFAAASAGEFVFFTNGPVRIRAASAIASQALSPQEVPARSSASGVMECTEVKGRYGFMLDAGMYVLGFTPTPQEGVGIVVLPAPAR